MKNRPDLAVATGLGRGVVAKGVLALAGLLERGERLEASDIARAAALAGRGGLIGAAIMAADELFSRSRLAA